MELGSAVLGSGVLPVSECHGNHCSGNHKCAGGSVAGAFMDSVTARVMGGGGSRRVVMAPFPPSAEELINVISHLQLLFAKYLS